MPFSSEQLHDYGKSKLKMESTQDFFDGFSVEETKHPVFNLINEMIEYIQNKYHSIEMSQENILLDIDVLMNNDITDSIKDDEEVGLIYKHTTYISQFHDLDQAFDEYSKVLDSLFAVVNMKLQLYESRFGEYPLTNVMKQCIWFDKSKRVFLFIHEKEEVYFTNILKIESVDLVKAKDILAVKGLIEKSDLESIFSAIKRN